MKKLFLLSCCLMLSYTYSQAQITVYCEVPASVAGSKTFTWADPGGGWGTKDLNIPANSVKDTVMVVDDGSSGDSLGCNPLINDLTGKIALVYRGNCQFGEKAKNAQDAGAVAVIIVNNIPGAPVGMAPGTQGANDTIPIVMISDADGAALHAAVAAGGNVVVFIGNKFGLYNNDLGFYAIHALTSRVTANPALISANATEFNVPMGAWLYNYGKNSQSNVTLESVISGAATYTAASVPATIAPGDSVYASIPTYSAASYSGFYEVNYNVKYGNTDDFPADNAFYSNFLIDSLFSYTLFDAATKKPTSLVHLKNNQTPPVEYKSCIHFRDANASRLAAMGIYASAGTATSLSLSGEAIDAVLYEWNDVFTGLSDPAFTALTAWTLNQVGGTGTYTYATDLQRKMVYIPFPAPIVLKDNQRYLFCNRTFSTDVNFGFDAHYNYDTIIRGSDQPVSIVIMDANYYATGFGTDNTCSVTALFGPYNMGVNDYDKSFDVTPYPNPTAEFIKIPLKGMNGTAQLNIMDMNGKVVSDQTVKVAETVSVNVTGIPNGNYVFNMLFEDGRNTTFKVVITK